MILPRPLRGIIPPLVTPLLDRGALDVSGLIGVIERVLAGGVHGVFILGSTGEAPSLGLDLRRHVIRETCGAVGGRVPVLVNVSDTAFAHCLQLAEDAAKAGAVAVVLSPPCYFPLDQDLLFAAVFKFAERSPLPVFLYNVPQYAHTEYASSTVERLSHAPNIAGIKNSNGNLEYLREVLRAVAHRPEFSILVGNEEKFLPALLAGAHGGVCGGANMFPELFVQLYEAFVKGRHSEAEAHHKNVVRVSDAIYTVGPLETSYLRGLKCALSLLGVINDVLADPLQSLNETQRKELEQRLNEVLEAVGTSG
jgi:2-dehydro-3-deoxy-D-pentonate aldolase